MVHFCFEIYLWRFKRVIGREVDRDEEQAALVRTFGWADDGRVPVEYVVLRPRASRARGWRIFLQVLYVVTQQIDERTRVVRERPSSSSSSSSSSCQSHLGTTFMAIENECNKSGTSSHRSRSSTSFVVSSRFWNVVVVVVVVSKVFSRDVRTHKKRRQKRRLFRGRKEKNAEKKRTHQRRLCEIETARARRDATRPRRLRRQKKNERRFPRAKIITTPRTTSSFVIRFDAIF